MYLINPNLRKSYRQRYRKIAFCISLVFHLVMVTVFVLFFLNQEETEVDKIHADILPKLSKQLVNKQKTPNPILVKRNEVIPVPQKRDVSIAKPNLSNKIAKLPSPATQSTVQGQLSASANFDPHFDEPNLSTDTRLKPNDKSMMSPELPSGVIGWTVSKERTNKSKGNSEKNTGKGVSKTGTGKKNGSSIGESDGNKDGSGSGHGSGDIGHSESNPSLKTIEKLTNDIVVNSKGNPVDIILIFDRSGRMNDYIKALVESLSDVSDAYKASKIDFMFGLTCFYTKKDSNTIEHTIELLPLTRNIFSYKHQFQEYYSISFAGNEGVLDAIHLTVTGNRLRTGVDTGIQFRRDSIKHLILLIDKKKFTNFTGKKGHTLDSIIELCQKNKVSVNVLGKDFPDHKRIAIETGGSWYKIPMNLIE